MDDLRYPIGKFNREFDTTAESRRDSIMTIETLPSELRKAVDGLDDSQLGTPYRPGGWTVRQAVHHVSDSHQNALTRFKLALTEELPTIRPYYEDRWSELADSRLPIEGSLKIIEGVHEHWAALLNSMTNEDFQRKLNHPESGEWTLDSFLAQYAWHSRHHTAQLTALREREGW